MSAEHKGPIIEINLSDKQKEEILASYAEQAHELDEAIKRFFKPKPRRNSRHAAIPNTPVSPADASGIILVHTSKLKEIIESGGARQFIIKHLFGVPGQNTQLDAAALRKKSETLDKELITAAKELDILEEVYQNQFPKEPKN